MAMDSVTRNKIRDLADAIVNESSKDSSMVDTGWAVIKTSNPSPVEENEDPGLFLTGNKARLYLEALQSLEEDSAVEHLTRRELDKALTNLVQDLDNNKEQLRKLPARRNRIAEFVSELSKPLEKYEVIFSIKWIKFTTDPLTVGGVEFREFNRELAIDWGYGTGSEHLQKLLDEVIGQSVGIVIASAGSPKKAAERAQVYLDRALNTLRVICAAHSSLSPLWDEQLLQRRGEFRAIRKIQPNAILISIGGGRIYNPINLEFNEVLDNLTKEFNTLLTPLYDGTMSGKFHEALLRSIEWIGASITREIDDHKIIDLCTALEAVLSTIDDQRKGEAISLRYLLLAVALDEGFFDFHHIYDLYSLRSRVIHGSTLGICGERDYIRLRAIAMEVIERAVKLDDAQGHFRRPYDFIKFLESREHLEKMITWLKNWSDPATKKVLNYAKNRLQETEPVQGT